MAGWGTFFGKVSEQFQGRIERLTNERASLIRKRNDLENKKNKTVLEDREYNKICKRIDEIDELLRNKAKD